MTSAITPQPSVLHLLTIFRQITSGEIRIPAFQREFVWSDKQIVDLLDSVLQGFPIGSILLWAVDKRILNTAPSGVTSFPQSPETFPANYVLDGMQRLSALYGVFHFGSTTKERRFEVYFDLAKKVFNRRELAEVTETSFPLAALFVPRQLLEHQARLANMPKGDVYIERLLDLQSAFQDYLVPVVTIRETDVARIVEIFEKINSTGTRLEAVDFMRAITWADDFDLNRALDQVASQLSERDFDLEAETVIKCVGLTLDVPPTTDGLLQMRKASSDTLRSAFVEVVTGLERCSSFLKQEFAIQSASFVPYEGQLLVLFKAIGMGEAKDSDFPKIVRWFWATGFNESLRGKPDHYVLRAVENWQSLLDGGIRGLEPRLKLNSVEFVERRLVSGAALSSAFVAMHAAKRARSLAGGGEINPASYMASKELREFEAVFSRSELTNANIKTASSRLFANVVLLDEESIGKYGRGGAKEAIRDTADRNDWATLRSQFIDEMCVQHLFADNVEGFLNTRAGLMFDTASELVGSD